MRKTKSSRRNRWEIWPGNHWSNSSSNTRNELWYTTRQERERETLAQHQHKTKSYWKVNKYFVSIRWSVVMDKRSKCSNDWEKNQPIGNDRINLFPVDHKQKTIRCVEYSRVDCSRSDNRVNFDDFRSMEESSNIPTTIHRTFFATIDNQHFNRFPFKHHNLNVRLDRYS